MQLEISARELECILDSLASQVDSLSYLVNVGVPGSKQQQQRQLNLADTKKTLARLTDIYKKRDLALGVQSCHPI